MTVNVVVMALLSDDPVMRINFVTYGAGVMTEQTLRVFDPGLKPCNLEFGVLQHFLQFYVRR